MKISFEKISFKKITFQGDISLKKLVSRRLILEDCFQKIVSVSRKYIAMDILIF